MPVFGGGVKPRSDSKPAGRQISATTPAASEARGGKVLARDSRRENNHHTAVPRHAAGLINDLPELTPGDWRQGKPNLLLQREPGTGQPGDVLARINQKNGTKQTCRDFGRRAGAGRDMTSPAVQQSAESAPWERCYSPGLTRHGQAAHSAPAALSTRTEGTHRDYGCAG